MHAVVIAELDKARPAVLLTRDVILPKLNRWTIAPITTTIRGLSTEVRVGPENGIDDESVISVDHITTVEKHNVLQRVGWLTAEQEVALTEAILVAFDLYP